MALEDLTGPSKFITALVAGNPVSADDRREGDDHIRGVKNVLRNTFPLLDGAVSVSAASMSATLTGGPYLALAGGTLNGSLYINKATSGLSSQIAGKTAGLFRWTLNLGNSIAETGANSGNHFSIDRFDDAGNTIANALQINRTNGEATFTSVSSGRGLAISDTGALGACFLLQTTGGTKTIRCKSDNNLAVVNSAGNADILTLQNDGRLMAGYGYQCKAGSTGSFTGSGFNFNWTGALAVWVDATNIGNMSVTASDERIKKDIKPLMVNDESFLRINPIKYRFADVGIFKDDGQDHWGFSAQNLLPLFRSMVNGDIAAVQENGDPQPASLDLTAILAQTMVQVQQLMRRVAALEAR